VKRQALVTITFIVCIQFLFCSTRACRLRPGKWAAELSKKDYAAEESAEELRKILTATDSADTFQFIEALEKDGKSKGDHFKARFNCIKAEVISLSLLQ